MRRIVTRVATVVAVGATLVSAACIHTSPDPRDEVRDLVHGSGYELRLKSGERFYGELLAVTDSTYVVRIDRRIAIAPMSMVTSLGFGWQEIATPSGELWAGDRETLRRHSRFPYGITPTAMAGLLRASGQASPDTLGKATR
jgi:hypothetical protein